LDLQAEQNDRGQGAGDLYEAVAALKRRHDLHPCSVGPRDAFALRRDSEREEVQELGTRYRRLTGEQRKRLPALLNSLAQLQVVIGDLESAQKDFQETTRLVSDSLALAEANHNVYRVALDRQDWSAALLALRQAAVLDPDSFAPFPLENYEPQQLFGAGGFGPTFLCKETARGTPVVVQTITPDYLDRPISEILQELKEIQELDHPTLVRIRDLGKMGVEPGRPYLVLEHVQGVSLAAHVARQGPLTPDQWLPICWALARALQALHGRGILHRTLWPGCVLLAQDGPPNGQPVWRVRLQDTGLTLKRTLIHASACHLEARLQTNLGRFVMETLPYAPSEVFGRPKGQVWIGPHSDLYSLGKLSAFALTGKPDPDGGDLLMLPKEWKVLLSDCCAWTISKRPQHAGEVLERLARMPGADDAIARIEKKLHEAAVDDHTAVLAEDPERVDAYIARGDTYFRQGDFAKAIADFSEAISRETSDPALLLRRAHSHARNQALDLAVADFTEALRLAPRNGDAYTGRAHVYAQQGDQKKAAADFSEALRITPKDVSLHYYRGNAHFAGGELDRAIADYTEALRLDARFLWALGSRGKAFIVKGEPVKGMADFSRLLQLDPNNARAWADRAECQVALGRPDRAVPDLSEAIRLEPSAGFLVQRAKAFGQAKEDEKALADFAHALELDPDNLGAWLGRGNQHFEAGRLDEALADYSEAATRQPELSVIFFNRANVHALQSNHAAAIVDYSEALRLDPQSGAAWFNRGNSYAERGALDAALADYSECIRLDPKEAAAWTNRGNTRARQGDLPGALIDFTEAIKLDSDDPVTLCNRANTYARADDFASATGDYNEALRLDPDNVRALNGRGATYAQMGELYEALADFTRAIELDPRFSRAYINRGNALAEKADFAAAIADYGEAIRLEPALAPAYFGRGVSYSSQGDDAMAIADFTKTLELNPGHVGAFNNRGNCRLRLKDVKGALADFTAAIAADPQFAPAYFNRANALADKGDLSAALADYDAALRLDPDDLTGYLNRGKAHSLRGDYALALADNLEAHRRHPDDARVANNLAWLWATCPVASLRDPAKALEFAQTACEACDWQEPGHLDTYAAALAAAGRFAEAAEWQRKAMALVPDAAKADFQKRLTLYEAGRPCIDGTTAPDHVV
jgi:tetratricopeptide (TPR) repeat protein